MLNFVPSLKDKKKRRDGDVDVEEEVCNSTDHLNQYIDLLFQIGALLAM